MMPRYWVIAPYDSRETEIWEKVWQYDLANGVIAIGWAELGDISTYDEAKLRQAIEDIYPDTKPQWKTWSFNSMWNFWHEIAPGDIVIARRGTKRIAAVGTVTGPAFCDKERGYDRVAKLTDDYYSNFITVKWHDFPRDIQFDEPVMSFQTIYEIPEEKYNQLVAMGVDTTQTHEFVLEKYLEDFLVSNFALAFKNRFKLYKDAEGKEPSQYITDIGRIDILAEDTHTGALVVVELKKGRTTDEVVGQTLRYMGWVKEKLCKPDQEIRGLIICKNRDEKLMYALKMTPQIELKLYSIDFHLSDS